MKDLSQTILKVKPTKAYVDEKLERLDKLIDEAKDAATKASYQNYKDFWLGKLSARSVTSRKKKEKLENELAAAEEKQLQDSIIEEITQQKEWVARDAAKKLKAEAARAKIDAEILAENYASAEAQEREDKATALLAQIKELEAKIKQNKEEEIDEISETQPEDPIDN